MKRKINMFIKKIGILEQSAKWTSVWLRLDKSTQISYKVFKALRHSGQA